MTVTAEIDVTRPVGRKLVRELESKKYVNITYPSIQGVGEKTHTLQDSFQRVENYLNEFYGTNFKLNY